MKLFLEGIFRIVDGSSFHAEMSVVVEQHPSNLRPRIVHRPVPDTTVPQDGVTRLPRQLNVIGHLLERIVLGDVIGLGLV